ncbi:16119_t:CDS:1 [Dentiscutata erythropus]|uniref:16119_t:CDS:1 n=1 Tax=Dentiscutata erythropus TaxID=1348616 RepID=A0A9N9P2M8_9GLOM|nr:16119_t:CDS:1 [Dentiscutata erythropus]
MPNLPTPNNRTKNLIALGGAILTFLTFQPTMHFVISGALAFGAYKIVKGTLNYIWPPVRSIRPIHPLYPQMSQIENTFWKYMSSSIRGITSEIKRSREVIDEIYSSSISKIQVAYNNESEIRFLFGDYDSSTIRFSDPQTVISKTLAVSDSRGNYQKMHGVTIEYIATGMNGESAFVKATGYLNNNDEVMFKEISLLWPRTGREINIPLQDTNNFEDNKYGPNVMEAEYRDIKE